LNFILNDETCAAFYRNLVAAALQWLCAGVALTVGDEVWRRCSGIRSGTRYVMIRISNAGEKWSNCSPGRLIIERTMAALTRTACGISISASAIMPISAARVTRCRCSISAPPLSWRGLPYALRDRAARALRRYPAMSASVKRALGKPPSREEN